MVPPGKELWGIIDEKGNEILHLKYDEIWNFYNKGLTYTYVSIYPNKDLGVSDVEKRRMYKFDLYTHDLSVLEKTVSKKSISN